MAGAQGCQQTSLTPQPQLVTEGLQSSRPKVGGPQTGEAGSGWGRTRGHGVKWTNIRAHARG